jgi:hypothetical protein
MNRFGNMTTLLYAASHDAPPSRVDISEVLRVGRRRRRRRAFAPVLAEALVLAVAVAVVTAVASGPPRPRPSPAAAVFPLDRRMFALGETLGLPLSQVGLTPVQQMIEYGERGDITLQVNASGSYQPPNAPDAPTVFGRPAAYNYPQKGGAAPIGIDFQWAPGAWATLTHTTLPGEPDLVTLAKSLRTDVNEPVRFPFTVSPPPSLRLGLVAPGVAGRLDGYSSLSFRVNRPPPSEPNDWTMDVGVGVRSWYQEPAPPYNAVQQRTQNATIGGRPARAQLIGISYSVELLDDPEFIVIVWIDDTKYFSPEDANALALSVRTFGTWDNTSQWTDKPIR